MHLFDNKRTRALYESFIFKIEDEKERQRFTGMVVEFFERKIVSDQACESYYVTTDDLRQLHYKFLGK